MTLLNVDERKVYSIDWRKELEEFFMGILSTMYSEDICKLMLDEALKQIRLPKFMGDFVSFSNDQYYSLNEENLSLEKIASVNGILPQSDIKNTFLQSVFTRKNWQDCLITDRVDVTDLLPAIQISSFTSKVWGKNKELKDLDVILSKCLRGELKEKVKKELDVQMSWPADAVAHLLIGNVHYFLCKSTNTLELRKRTISSETIEEIVNSAFNGIKLEQAEVLINFLSNKIIFGVELEYPIRITYHDENSSPSWKGTFSLLDEEYECFYIHRYSSYLWVGLVPLCVIKKLYPGITSINESKEIEKMFSSNSNSCNKIRNLYRETCHDENHPDLKDYDVQPFKGAFLMREEYDKPYKWIPYEYDGKKCKSVSNKNISNTELAKYFVLVEINKIQK